ncbi:MAG: hypothetical protein ACI4RJ_01350 [Alphaproteobacteria bacterium]
MKKIYLICFILTAFVANAQQMIVPSSFDENKMIVKQMDENGNFVPVDENTLTDNPVVQTSVSNDKHTLQKTQNKEQEKTDIKQKTKEAPKRKFKRIEKDYSMPKSTFGGNVYDTQLPSTFSNETMERAQNALEEERYSFQECAPDDKDCQEYDIDSKGNIILK